MLILAWVSGLAQTAPSALRGNGEDIIPFLNQTLIWHVQLKTQQQLVSEPSDVLFLNDNRQIADQVVRVSFDFVREQAPYWRRQTRAAPAQATSRTSSFQGLTASS